MQGSLTINSAPNRSQSKKRQAKTLQSDVLLQGEENDPKIRQILSGKSGGAAPTIDRKKS